jgi:hypothetical protein
MEVRVVNNETLLCHKLLLNKCSSADDAFSVHLKTLTVFWDLRERR